MKDRLPGALEFPSYFMNMFLKRKKDVRARNLSTLNRMLIAKNAKGASKPGANQDKYAKQAKNIADNFVELASADPKTEFNEEDFVRPAFLQYLICAFCYEVE